MTDQPTTILVTRDADLTATAKLIADLRAKNADLEHQLAVMQAERIKPVHPLFEVDIVYDASAAALQSHLNDGWNVLHIQFVADALHIVFSREARPASLIGDRPAVARVVSAPVPPVSAPPRPTIHDALNQPIVRALMSKGINAVKEDMNGEALDAGQRAFDTALPPSAFSAIPALVPGRVSK